MEIFLLKLAPMRWGVVIHLFELLLSPPKIFSLSNNYFLFENHLCVSHVCLVYLGSCLFIHENNMRGVNNITSISDESISLKSPSLKSFFNLNLNLVLSSLMLTNSIFRGLPLTLNLSSRAMHHHRSLLYHLISFSHVGL